MTDQNNAPERIWIKPCDPCENPYDYYVCDPRYLDGRETSYVKSIVSCAGCGGGLKRQSGQFVCRDCGKAETVQEVLARADRAAPTDNTALVEEQRMKEHYRNCWKAQLERANGLEAALASREAPPAATTDNTALVEECWWCEGTGLSLDDAGEPGICHKCKGDTVIPAAPAPGIAEAARVLANAVEDYFEGAGGSEHLAFLDIDALRALEGRTDG